MLFQRRREGRCAWLLTLGLPTTLAVLAVTFLWTGGGLGPFLGVAASLSLLFHAAGMYGARRLWEYWRSATGLERRRLKLGRRAFLGTVGAAGAAVLWGNLRSREPSEPRGTLVDLHVHLFGVGDGSELVDLIPRYPNLRRRQGQA
jgi:hypothetical protein